MNEYILMSLSDLKIQINKSPCAHGKCYTDPRYYYALRLWEGKDITENKIEAFYYFKEAADYGHEGACLKVGKCYYMGDGCTQDYEHALKYFQRVIRTHAMCQIGYLWIGKCYLKMKKGFEKEAFEYFKKVVNDHRVSTLDEEIQKEALFILGFSHYHGIFIEKNTKQAFEYFEKAAIGNYSNRGAQYYLVKCFRDGIGTKQDPSMAAYWSLKCFDQNFENIIQETMACIGITKLKNDSHERF